MPVEHVIISYSQLDTDFAELLVTELEAVGVNVWIDRTRIKSGYFDSKIERAIEVATDLVLVVSPRSAGSDWVRDEFAFARRELGADHIHPVIIERVAWMGLDRLHSHDATDGRVPASLLQKLKPADSLEQIDGVTASRAVQMRLEIGSISRFVSEASLARYAGMAPFGSHYNGRLRSLVLAAADDQSSPGASGHIYYSRLRSEGRSHAESLTRIGRQVVRRSWRILRAESPLAR